MSPPIEIGHGIVRQPEKPGFFGKTRFLRDGLADAEQQFDGQLIEPLIRLTALTEGDAVEGACFEGGGFFRPNTPFVRIHRAVIAVISASNA